MGLFISFIGRGRFGRVSDIVKVIREGVGWGECSRGVIDAGRG